MDLNALYQVIRTVAITHGLITYGDLSLRYATLTGATPSGHTEWDRALKEIDQRLFNADPKAPTISALVVYNPPRYPAPHSSFWYYAPNGPAKPSTGSDALWARIVDEVHAFDWPPTLP
jgi:hypothetical protein